MDTFTLLIIIVMVVLGQLFLLNNAFMNKNKQRERFSNSDDNNLLNQCPNILMQEDNKYYLYNSNTPKIEGVNPLVFNNLDEYVKFLELQKSKNINCPILFLQNTYDAQGKPSFIARPSPVELQGGLPHESFNNYAINRGNNSLSTSNNNIFNNNGNSNNNNNVSSDGNINSLPLPDEQPREINLNDASKQPPYFKSDNYDGFDPNNQYIGVTTPLDKMFHDNNSSSPNPMDPNWGGPHVTQEFVDERYKMNPYKQSIVEN
jgi:hypothetical protein